jgi:feruloyl-CoA synthase
VFDGRLAEDFKLAPARECTSAACECAESLRCAPLAQDIVVTGHDGECVRLSGVSESRSVPRASPTCRPTRPRMKSSAHPRSVRASATACTRCAKPGRQLDARCACAAAAEPPSIDAGEITDKGYINQRAVRERRAGMSRCSMHRSPRDNVITL